MSFEYSPTIHIDEFPEHIAVLIFGEPLIKKCYRKAFKKKGGFFEITEVDRNTKSVTFKYVKGM